MRGSPQNQIKSIIKVSQIYKPGTSKFAEQTKARAVGAAGSHQVGQATALYSKESYKTYASIWKQYAEFARGELGVKNLEKSTADTVRQYLEHRIEQGVARSTWDKEASAMNKFATALQKVSDNLGRGERYDFTAAIDSVRLAAKAELDVNSESRAYSDPARVVGEVRGETFQIAANLQYEGGARISEIESLTPQQFRGYSVDRITGETVGVIHLENCKGGYDRPIYVSPATYDRALALVREEGTFKIEQNEYRAELREACDRVGEIYSGSHGLRWNFARERVQECQEHGLRYDQALRETSEDMGHHREKITEHYLR